jgi:hypothetical protein
VPPPKVSDDQTPDSFPPDPISATRDRQALFGKS